MDRDVLLALAERCEKASGPSLDLDLEIAVVMGVVGPPHYTASVDAALGLVPEGLPYAGMRRFSDGWYVVFCAHSSDADTARGRSDQAKTLAGGICAAALRARAALA